MAKARGVSSPYRDWVVEAEEDELRKDPWWRPYLVKMGSQLEFKASEAASVINCPTTDAIYAYVDSGELDGMNRGTGKKRYVVFTRTALKAFLAGRRTGV